ncbi:MAG TPA: sigma-70 family RNA polymerase sigma factor [Syntrophorhabdaceae bacterium]|nr:sigma-70 family RNA polymerase sigma factor [Syntrophorhabdaceae bacterium]HOD75551.1 sigma-70 family RNA polymerase sigma factor [Syntrophorhabdaceae bacterium]
MKFDFMVKRLSPVLKRITKRLNGHHAYFDEEDLYQEALTHLWGAFRKGSIDDKTDSYILQGCYYHLKNHLRKVRENAVFVSLSEPAGEDGISWEEMIASDESSSFARLEDKLKFQSITDACSSDRDRQVLTLLMEDLSVREVGTRLGISHVMVLKIRNRIRDNYFRRIGEK